MTQSGPQNIIINLRKWYVKFNFTIGVALKWRITVCIWLIRLIDILLLLKPTYKENEDHYHQLTDLLAFYQRFLIIVTS